MKHQHEASPTDKPKAKSATVKTPPTETTAEPVAAMPEKMDHAKMQHGDHPKMGMEGHDHGQATVERRRRIP